MRTGIERDFDERGAAVSDEMVMAGLAVYFEFDRDCDNYDFLVREIFLAMDAARPPLCQPASQQE